MDTPILFPLNRLEVICIRMVLGKMPRGKKHMGLYSGGLIRRSLRYNKKKKYLPYKQEKRRKTNSMRYHALLQTFIYFLKSLQ